MTRARSLLLIAVAALLSPATAHAAWPSGPAGTLVLDTTSTAALVQAIADGAGGSFVVWARPIAGAPGVSPQLVATHVLADGSRDPVWPAHGRLLFRSGERLASLPVVPDGLGGAWFVAELNDTTIRALHLSARAARLSGTDESGSVIVAHAFPAYYDAIADGSGGLLLGWYEARPIPQGWATMAQHVLGDGSIDGAWPVDGLQVFAPAQVFNPSGPLQPLQIVADGDGGAFFAGTRAVQSYPGPGGDTFTNFAGFLTHVLASGARDPLWGSNDTPISFVGQYQTMLRMVADGRGGVVVAWQEMSAGTGSRNPGGYLQSFTRSGVGGLAHWVNQYCEGLLVPAGDAGVWEEASPGLYVSPEVRLRRFGAALVPDLVWPGDGVLLSEHLPIGTGLGLVPEPSGAVLRIANTNASEAANRLVTATRFLPDGSLDASYPVSGLVLASGFSFAAAAPSQPAAGEGAHDVLIAWAADPSPGTHGVFAQRVLLPGHVPSPEPGSSRSDPAPDGSGDIDVTWQPSAIDTPGWQELREYRLWLASGAARDASPERASRPGGPLLDWTLAATVPATHAPAYTTRIPRAAFDPVPAGGVTLIRIEAVDADGVRTWSSAPVPVGPGVTGVTERTTALALAPPRPSPARRSTRIDFTLPRATNVRLSIFDVRGRLVRTLVSGNLPAGTRSEDWDLCDTSGELVGPGLWFVRLSAGSHRLERRLVTLQ